MKIVTITLGDAGQRAVEAGWIILNYAAQEGGRTGIGVLAAADKDGVMPAWDDLARDLNANMGRPEWPKFVKSKQQGNQVRLSCPDEMDKVAFFAEFQPVDGARRLHPDFVRIADEGF